MCNALWLHLLLHIDRTQGAGEQSSKLNPLGRLQGGLLGGLLDVHIVWTTNAMEFIV